jgi:hypothetical protein
VTASLVSTIDLNAFALIDHECANDVSTRWRLDLIQKNIALLPSHYSRIMGLLKISAPSTFEWVTLQNQPIQEGAYGGYA